MCSRGRASARVRRFFAALPLLPSRGNAAQSSPLTGPNAGGALRCCVAASYAEATFNNVDSWAGFSPEGNVER